MTIAGHGFDLRRGQIERRMGDVLADPVAQHFVVVNGRRYPPKQVISEVTGLDRADFTTHQARRILMRLGFATGRRATRRPEQEGRPRRHADRDLVEALRSLVGEWVAVQGDEVLVSAHSAQEVVAWLSQHGQRADTMFRVPEDEIAGGGLAPS
ncbi:MAG: hypothetical protein ACRDL4_16980 [Thermoleophilaceae bacterium]